MLDLERSYATDLDDAFWIPWEGADVPDPRVILANTGLAHELGLDVDLLRSAEGAELLSGMRTPAGSQPVAQAYAGHQFGGFSSRLGDGRALLLGEIRDPRGRQWDLHLKGSGRTPFSRGGDGKAVLGPVLREYLIGEAMHALGIPTTRGLAALVTGEQVMRQNGLKPGAILARVASSHLRVGTFEYFAARGDHARVRNLVDYALERHDPERLGAEDPALELFRTVRGRQATLVAQWMGVGFIHGVMNTDNTSISGETIDYGPCAFMDTYHPETVFSSIDQFGRYAYRNQPGIAQWNLACLAQAMLDILPGEGEARLQRAQAIVDGYPAAFQAAWLAEMGAKIGLRDTTAGDADLITDLLDRMAANQADFTRTFRGLADGTARDEFVDPTVFDAWAQAWAARGGRADGLDRVNPLYIPRNHLVAEAIAAAEADDFAPFHRLVEVLADPFTPQQGRDAYALPPAPEQVVQQTFCGT